MDKLKEPSMLLSVVNTVGMVGAVAYLYKQIEAMRLDYLKMAENMNKIGQKIIQMEKGNRDNSDIIHKLTEEMKKLNDTIENVPRFEDVNDIKQDIDDVVSSLCDHNINIELQSQLPPPPPSNVRRTNKYKNKNKNSFNNSSRELSREKHRESRAPVPPPQPMDDQVDDDEFNLIAAVRNQAKKSPN